MMIFSLVAMIGLEKCCITSACLQWLCHSDERTVAHGPLVENWSHISSASFSWDLSCLKVFFFNITLIIGAISTWSSFSNNGLRLSGPAALPSFRLFSSLSMPFTDISMSNKTGDVVRYSGGMVVANHHKVTGQHRP